MTDGNGHDATLLFVDNRQENIPVLRRLLGRDLPDCRVITCLNAVEGLAIASEAQLDGALINVQIPEVDGIEMCRRLKADPSTAHIPVSLMAGSGSDSALKAAGLEAGAVDFIATPIESEELIARIKVMFRIKREEDEIRQANVRLAGVAKKWTQALRNSEAMWQSLACSAPDVIAMLDRDGRIRFVNHAPDGSAAEDMIGRNISDFLPPAQRDRMSDAIEEVFQAGNTVSAFETSLTLPNGRQAWYATQLGPIKRGETVVRAVQFATEITQRKETEQELRKRTHDLGERVKELNCLYGIADLVVQPGISLAQIAQGVAELIPPSWQYPKIACARVVLDGQEYTTDNFAESAWKQECEIVAHDRSIGRAQVFYLEQRPEECEGPFLAEERSLLNAIAERLGRITEGKQAEQEAADLAKFPEENPNPVLRVRADGRVLYANAAARTMMPEGRMCAAGGIFQPWMLLIAETLASGTQRKSQEKLGERTLSFVFAPVVEGDYVNIYGMDITNRKSVERELARQAKVDAALAEMSQILISPSSIEEISAAVLHHAKELTGSQFGYVGYINSTTGHLVCPTLTEDIWHKCDVADKSTVFKEFGGLWGWVLDHRESLFTNAPSEDPRSMGTPPGHIPIQRLLSVPAMHGDDLLGQIALANSDRDYTETDLAVIGRLAASYALAVHRQRTEDSLQLSHHFLQIANRHLAMPSLLRQFAGELKRFSGCAAVGLRVLNKEGSGLYESCDGFDEDFWKSENDLSIHSDHGMCVNVIDGKTDPDLPYYTEGGSFYLNDATRFLAACSPDQKAQIGNVCSAAAYESVALVPIRLGSRILGLIHVADPREDAVPPTMVSALERVGMQLGTAIRRVQAEEALRDTKDELELRVRRRTTDLAQAVEDLQGEARDRVRAEQALTEQSRVLEAFFKHTITPLVFLDKDFNFIRVNEAYASACQRNPEDFKGHNYFDLFPSDTKAIFEGVIRTKQPHQAVARRLVFPGRPQRGETYWDWTLVPILDGEGDASALVFSLEDVTERERAEQVADDERRRLFSVLNMLPGYVCLHANDYTIRFANRTFIEVLGPPEDKPCYQLLHNRATPCANCPAIRVFHTRLPQEWEEVSASGRTYHVWGYPFADVDGAETVLELGVDVTERKELEKQVIKASETVQRSIGRDLHDTLGQNLTGLAFLIKGLAQNLTTQSPQDAVTANQIVDLVNESVSQVRALARGLDPVGMRDEGLAAGLSELAANARNVFGVSCDVRCEQPVFIDDDVAGHLYHIAQEAVNNAIKHANVGHISITLGRNGHTISLTIEDDGSGINPDPDLCKGNGLGMHIMRYRASVIGGSLSVGPGQWGGTVVACCLPSSDASQTDGNANE